MGGSFLKAIERLVKGKKLILFGTGKSGAEAVVLELDGYDIAYFCDNDPVKWGKTFLGIPIKSPAVLAGEDPNQILVIITSMYKQEISDDLIRLYGIYAYDTSIFLTIEDKKELQYRYEQLCFHKSELDKVYNLLADDESKQRFNLLLENYKDGMVYYGNVKSKRKQYFNDFFRDCIEGSEVYIDAGVYNEGTIVDFIQYVDNKYEKIYAFEPAPERYSYLLDKFSNSSKKINIIHAALTNLNGETSFGIAADGEAYLSSEGGYKVKALKLDDAIDGKVTFIKMDIEGSEYDALIGAQNIIKRYKPKLAISLYHRNDDLWRLPLLIHEMMPEYKLFIDHHTNCYRETVLYARI